MIMDAIHRNSNRWCSTHIGKQLTRVVYGRGRRAGRRTGGRAGGRAGGREGGRVGGRVGRGEGAAAAKAKNKTTLSN
jgi:hypothetical protein